MGYAIALIIAAVVAGIGALILRQASGTDDFGAGAFAWMCWGISALIVLITVAVYAYNALT